MIKNNSIKLLNNLSLWGFFILYVIIAGYTTSHHELWGDEIHSWNIAKSSKSFFELISNTRYEGHPPLWYIFLWTISKFTHDLYYIQLVHLIIASLVVFIILFYSPFPFAVRSIIPFGYFFLFEYSILSRNYAIGILIAFIICIIIHKNFKGKHFFYYLLLFLLSNTHLLSLVLAACFHLYFLFCLKEQEKKTRIVVNHLLIGLCIFLPSIYFIFPPADSSLNTTYWMNRWDAGQLSSIIQLPVRAFIPIPLWFEYHFWDTNILIGKENLSVFSKLRIPLISAGIVLLVIHLLKQDKKSLFFFLFYLLLVVMISFVIPFTNARHAGFIFIGFLIAAWLYFLHQPFSKSKTWILFALLLPQVVGGIIAVLKDIKYPFSNGNKVNELIVKIPAGEKIVTDYWTLNTLSAFTDKPYYCIDLQREATYILWNNELGAVLKKNDRYSSGIATFMNKGSIKKVYMISTQRMGRLHALDNKLPEFFNVRLIDSKEGAIEKGGDLYLYEITAK